MTPYEHYKMLWEKSEDGWQNPILPEDNKWWPLDHMIYEERFGDYYNG